MASLHESGTPSDVGPVPETLPREPEVHFEFHATEPVFGPELHQLLVELHKALHEQHTPTLAILQDLRQDIVAMRAELAEMVRQAPVPAPEPRGMGSEASDGDQPGRVTSFRLMSPGASTAAAASHRSESRAGSVRRPSSTPVIETHQLPPVSFFDQETPTSQRGMPSLVASFRASTAHLGEEVHPAGAQYFQGGDGSRWSSDWFKAAGKTLLSGKVMFRLLSATSIALNAIFIGVTEMYAVPRALAGESRDHDRYLMVKAGMVLLMMLELGARRHIQGVGFWGKQLLPWNTFDALIICCNWVQIGLQMAHHREYRTLNFFGLLRLIRLAHLLPKLHTLRLFVSMFRISVGVFAWAMTVLLGMVFTYAVFVSSQISLSIERGYVGGWDKDPSVYDSYEEWEQDIRNMYWNLPGIMSTLFGAISGGTDWLIAADPLRHLRYGPFMRASFILFVMVTVFCLSNLLIAAMVESARDVLQMDREVVIRNQEIAERAQVARLHRIFQKEGDAGNGGVSRSEIEAALRDTKTSAYLRSLGVDATEIWGTFHLLQKDQDDIVDLIQFVQKIFELRGPSKSVDLVSLINAQRNSARLLDAYQNSVSRKLERIERTISVSAMNGLPVCPVEDSSPVKIAIDL